LIVQHFGLTSLFSAKEKRRGKIMERVARLVGALGVVLAVVAGVVAIPGLNIALILIVLGVIAGAYTDQDNAVRMFLAVLALPVIGVTLGGVPAIGGYLTAIFTNLSIAAAGITASLVARRLYDTVMGAVTSPSGS